MPLKELSDADMDCDSGLRNPGPTSSEVGSGYPSQREAFARILETGTVIKTPKQISMEIIEEAARMYGVSMKSMLGGGMKDQPTTMARWKAVKDLTEKRKLSSSRVARYLEIKPATVHAILNEVEKGRSPHKGRKAVC